MTPHRTILSMLAVLAAVAGPTPRSAPALELLVSDPGANAVLEYNTDTRAFRGIFASGGGLTEPSGLALGPDGNLYVGSLDNTVKRYNGATGAFIDTFASAGGLRFPGGITFGPDGNLYVTSGFSASVLRYDGKTGAFLDAFATGGGLSLPTGLVFGPDGNLYVAGAISKVLRYDGKTGRSSILLFPSSAAGC